MLQRSRWVWPWFLLIVVVPTAVAAYYTATTTARMYLSQARFAIEDRQQSPLSGLDGVMSSFGLSSGEPKSIYTLRHYIQSHDALRALEARVPFDKVYAAPHGDALTRLSGDATFDERLRYYRRMVIPRVSTTENLITLDVWAFDPDVAQALSQNLLELAETFVNDINARVNEDQVNFYVRERDKAEANLLGARRELTAWRNANNMVSPMAEVEMVQTLVSALENELAKITADIAGLQEAYTREREGPRIRTLQLRQDEIQRQINEAKNRIAGMSEETSANKIEEYETLVSNAELAQENLRLAMTSVEAARQLVMKQQRYLLTITNPSLPSEPSFPLLTRHVSLVFVVALMAFGILALLHAIIRDYCAG